VRSLKKITIIVFFIRQTGTIKKDLHCRFFIYILNLSYKQICKQRLPNHINLLIFYSNFYFRQIYWTFPKMTDKKWCLLAKQPKNCINELTTLGILMSKTINLHYVRVSILNVTALYYIRSNGRNQSFLKREFSIKWDAKKRFKERKISNYARINYLFKN
jgi:hypothetical protein